MLHRSPQPHPGQRTLPLLVATLWSLGLVGVVAATHATDTPSTTTAAAQVRHTPLPEDELSTGLCAGGDDELFRAVERLELE